VSLAGQYDLMAGFGVAFVVLSMGMTRKYIYCTANEMCIIREATYYCRLSHRKQTSLT